MQRSTIAGPEGGITPTRSAGAHRNIPPRPALASADGCVWPLRMGNHAGDNGARDVRHTRHPRHERSGTSVPHPRSADETARALYRRRARQTTKNIPIELCTACPRVVWFSHVAADRARTGELAIPSGFGSR